MKSHSEETNDVEVLKARLEHEQNKKKSERMPLYEAWLEFCIKVAQR